MRVAIQNNLWVVLTLLAGTLLVACDREGRARAEAHTFLALYTATDHRAPGPERERKIAQLEQLTLTDETVRAARDECVGAHRRLLDAERENESAAAQLDKALAALPNGEVLPPADTTQIRAGIDKAERSLADARTRFEKCETQARSLSLRYGDR